MQRKLRLLRLFDLHDHVGPAPDFFGASRRWSRRRPGRRVGKAAAEARAFLNEHFMIARDETGDAGGSDRDPILFGFDFLGNADDHRKRLNDGADKRQKERGNSEWSMEYWSDGYGFRKTQYSSTPSFQYSNFLLSGDGPDEDRPADQEGEAADRSDGAEPADVGESSKDKDCRRK